MLYELTPEQAEWLVSLTMGEIKRLTDMPDGSLGGAIRGDAEAMLKALDSPVTWTDSVDAQDEHPELQAAYNAGMRAVLT